MATVQVNSKLPLVAIVGSPNVGKSTLFNRLLHKRRSITDAMPGVTRDPVESECGIDEIKFRLIDTGGYKKTSDESLDDDITEKSIKTLESADLILFLIDIKNITPNDQAFIEKLRAFSGKLILVVNKIDNDIKEDLIWEYYSLGFETVVGISAVHGRNIEELKEKISAFLADKVREPANTATEQIINLAIMGKPNTGKSTLSNYFLGEEKSLVSDIPGTTRDVIEGLFRYKNRLFRVLDTAGIRRKNKVKESVEYYSVNRAIGSIEQSDVVILVIDTLENVTDQDKKIASLIVKQGKGIVLVLNKFDLLSPMANREQALKDRLHFLFPVLHFAPILFTSALAGKGVDEVLNTCLRVYDQLNKEVKTSDLNQRLKQWLLSFPVPSGGKNIKIRYATQLSRRPQKFLFFVNKLRIFPRSYEKYLMNKIRENLGMQSIPLEIVFREK